MYVELSDLAWQGVFYIRSLARWFHLHLVSELRCQKVLHRLLAAVLDPGDVHRGTTRADPVVEISSILIGRELQSVEIFLCSERSYFMRPIVLLRQQSYAIKNQLYAPY